MKKVFTCMLLLSFLFAFQQNSGAQVNLKKLKDKAKKINLKKDDKSNSQNNTNATTNSNNTETTTTTSNSNSSTETKEEDNNLPSLDKLKSSSCFPVRFIHGSIKGARENAQKKDFRNAKADYNRAANSLLDIKEKCPDQLEMVQKELDITLQIFKENGLDLEAELKWNSLRDDNRSKVSDFRTRYCKDYCIIDDYISAKTFFEITSKLNYPELKSALTEIEGKVDGLKDDFDYKQMANLDKDFEAGIGDFHTQIKQAMNKAKASQAKGASEAKQAYEHIKGAEFIVNGILMILPDNAETKTKKQEVDKLMAEIGADYESKVFTSAFHKENVGKILFSKSPIVIKKEDPAQFTNSFTTSDHIYAIAYFDASIADMAGGYPSNEYVRFLRYIDDELVQTYTRIKFDVLGENTKKSYFITEIIPDPSTAMGLTDAILWESGLLSQIQAGEHDIEIKLEFRDKNRAIGKIKVNWDGYDAEKIKNDAKKACSNADNNLAMSRKLPPEFSKPSGKFSDPGMSTAKIKQMIISNSEFKDLSQILKLSIGSDQDWFINKDGAVIKGRFNGRAVRLVYKAKDGFCYYIPNVTFNCTYLGNGRYSAPKAHIPSGSKVKIACSNVK